MTVMFTCPIIATLMRMNISDNAKIDTITNLALSPHKRKDIFYLYCSKERITARYIVFGDFL